MTGWGRVNELQKALNARFVVGKICKLFKSKKRKRQLTLIARWKWLEVGTPTKILFTFPLSYNHPSSNKLNAYLTLTIKTARGMKFFGSPQKGKKITEFLFVVRMIIIVIKFKIYDILTCIYQNLLIYIKSIYIFIKYLLIYFIYT